MGPTSFPIEARFGGAVGRSEQAGLGPRAQHPRSEGVRADGRVWGGAPVHQSG